MLKKLCFLTLCFLFVFCENGFSQLRRTLHQTIDLSNSVSVKLDLDGDYELVHWAGNHFLIETNIALYDANKHLLKHLVDQGRYEVAQSGSGSQALIEWKDAERRKVMYRQKECFEEAKVKVYIPDFFEIINPTTLINNKLKEEFPNEIKAAMNPPKEEEEKVENDEIEEKGDQ